MFLGKYSEEQVHRFKALADFQFECEIYDKDAVLVMCEKYVSVVSILGKSILRVLIFPMMRQSQYGGKS